MTIFNTDIKLEGKPAICKVKAVEPVMQDGKRLLFRQFELETDGSPIKPGTVISLQLSPKP